MSSTDISLGCRSSSVNTSYFNVFWYAINSSSSQLNYKADYIAIGKWKQKKKGMMKYETANR